VPATSGRPERLLAGDAPVIGAKPVMRKVPYQLAQSVGFLLKIIGHVIGKKNRPCSPTTPPGSWAATPSSSAEKARRELGWKPAFTYEQGHKNAVEWCPKTSERKPQHIERFTF